MPSIQEFLSGNLIPLRKVLCISLSIALVWARFQKFPADKGCKQIESLTTDHGQSTSLQHQTIVSIARLFARSDGYKPGLHC